MKHRFMVKLSEQEFQYMAEFLHNFRIPIRREDFLVKCMIHSVGIMYEQAKKLQELEVNKPKSDALGQLQSDLAGVTTNADTSGRDSTGASEQIGTSGDADTGGLANPQESMDTSAG